MPAKTTSRTTRKKPNSWSGSKEPAAPVASRPVVPASYGVKTGSKGLLDWQWASDRMKQSENYILVTVRPDGRPHAMGMHGLWAENGFYFGTGTKTRKARNLAKNPRCIIINDRLDEMVIVEGTADIISLSQLPRGLSEESKKKYGWPMHEDRESSIYRVRPTKVFGIPLKQFGTSFTRWKFDES